MHIDEGTMESIEKFPRRKNIFLEIEEHVEKWTIHRNGMTSWQVENRKHTQTKKQAFHQKKKNHFSELEHSVCFLFFFSVNLLAKTQVTWLPLA